MIRGSEEEREVRTQELCLISAGNEKAREGTGCDEYPIIN